jgi:asparagine synthetase B (glutamine-hydrolysing)
MLVDDPVKRVDNMTMAWGLEARTPFFDYRVVELSARVPGKFKLPDGGKQVLKESARLVIPAEVIDRKKGYFPVPGLKHLQGDTLQWVRELLLDPSQDRGLFRPEMLDSLSALSRLLGAYILSPPVFASDAQPAKGSLERFSHQIEHDAQMESDTRVPPVESLIGQRNDEP